MKQHPPPHKPKTGFTLVELMVVMTIIGLLMGLVIGVAGSVQRGAAEAQAKAQIADLMNELEIYNTEKGEYPSSWTEFGTWYNTKYSGTRYDMTEGTSSRPIDPWGGAYVYNRNSDFIYLIGSKGPDGENGIEGNRTFGRGDDITNRNGKL